MDKGQLAYDNFKAGLNCTQAVVLAFKDEMGIDEVTLKRLSIGFGGGLGRQRLVCGAVSGMCMVLSYLLSDGVDKASIYAIIKEACEKFKAETGSIICGELLGVDICKDKSTVPEPRTKEYYKKRPCAEMCRLAAEIAESYIR